MVFLSSNLVKSLIVTYTKALKVNWKLNLPESYLSLLITNKSKVKGHHFVTPLVHDMGLYLTRSNMCSTSCIKMKHSTGKLFRQCRNYMYIHLHQQVTDNTNPSFNNNQGLTAKLNYLWTDVQDRRIDRTFEMASDAPTNVGIMLHCMCL